MAYESQIAGVGDDPPGRPLYARAVRLMQRRSAAELAVRRAAIVAAIRALTPLEFVNGGGTGSLTGTAAEPAVTEIAAGSGLYQPTLFDAYRGLTGLPAALFRAAGCAPCRDPAWSRCSVAATSRPGRGLRAGCRPRTLPAGLRLDREEGAGEVQTPLIGPAADSLALGDRVWLRHAKAGEALRAVHRAAPDRRQRSRRDGADLSRRGTDLLVTSRR